MKDVNKFKNWMLINSLYLTNITGSKKSGGNMIYQSFTRANYSTDVFSGDVYNNQAL